MYELSIKDIVNHEIVWTKLMFSSFKGAKKYGAEYKKEHPLSSIHRIKEVRVYS